MRRIVAPLAFGTGLLLLSSACVPLAQTKATEPSPQTAPAAAPAPAPASPAQQKPAAPQPAAPQAPKAAVKSQLSLEEVQARRQIEKELERDVDAYYDMLKDRNVERAIEMTSVDARPGLQTQLWEFISRYSVETHDIRDKKIDFDRKPYSAEVTVGLTVYENRSVSPKKMPVSSRWQYAGGNWLILTPGK